LNNSKLNINPSNIFFINLLFEWLFGVLSAEDDSLLSTAALKLLHRLTAAAA